MLIFFFHNKVGFLVPPPNTTRASTHNVDHSVFEWLNSIPETGFVVYIAFGKHIREGRKSRKRSKKRPQRMKGRNKMTTLIKIIFLFFSFLFLIVFFLNKKGSVAIIEPNFFETILTGIENLKNQTIYVLCSLRKEVSLSLFFFFFFS